MRRETSDSPTLPRSEHGGHPPRSLGATNRDPAPTLNPSDPNVRHELIGPTLCRCGGMVHESDTVCANGGTIAT